jgi:hypothetical protein
MYASFPRVLPVPALTDHAFLTPHGQLLRALEPLAGGWLSLLGPTLPPLVAELSDYTQAYTPVADECQVLAPGTHVLVVSVSVKTGLVTLLAHLGDGTQRFCVYADGLQHAHTEEGDTLLDLTLARLKEMKARA